MLIDEGGQRFTDELAPRDVVARAIDERGTALLDLRGDRPQAALPALMDATRGRTASIPRSSRSPSRPRRTTRWAAVVTDLDGRDRRSGPLRRRRVRLHRSPRREPARLELAARMPRLRPRGPRCQRLDRAFPDLLPAAPRPVRTRRVTPELARGLWQDAGLIRDADGLARLASLAHGCSSTCSRESALARTESRGGHFRTDFPVETDAFAAHTVLRPGQEPVLRAMAVTGLDVARLARRGRRRRRPDEPRRDRRDGDVRGASSA